MSLTVENQIKIEHRVKEIFPHASVKLYLGELKAHVTAVRTDQLVQLHDLVTDQDSELCMRRSGTGISIIFS